jgi:hypothetical protein
MTQPKQSKNIQQSIYAPNTPTQKEAARIEDRPITMAPKADIERGRQFFKDKVQRHEAKVRQRIAEGLPANVPTDTEIVAAVNAVRESGVEVGLTTIDDAGVERPTKFLTMLLKNLRDE